MQIIIEQLVEDKYHLYVPGEDNKPPKWEAQVSRLKGKNDWEIVEFNRDSWELAHQKTNTDEARAIGFAVLRALETSNKKDYELQTTARAGLY